ncbi:MAG: GNAT family N-acetyltransferase [Desulfobacteraceae bacterium]|jgi:ribosomal protein S18 acetylase RimI-like enzyme|nr:MAG: GNAT family N-acetyltransferase [Desulfobacteraceae bacterium]
MYDYLIRAMARSEIDLAIEWAAREDWNPGLHDADCYFAADPNGFLTGLLSGKPIATLSAVKYGDTFGFLGFYIVSPAFRGQGYGIQIWNAGLNYLSGRNVGLDGVVDQQKNYKKSGFVLAYRNVRYEGSGGGDCPEGIDIVDLASLPFETVDSYDKPFSPDDRSEFIKSWVCQPDSHALGVWHAGKLNGYGVIRPCRTGYKIGPLFADTAAIAESLFLALKSKIGPNDSVFLDVPEINDKALELAETCNMRVMFETARMYNLKIPDLPIKRIYGVTSFEVG